MPVSRRRKKKPGKSGRSRDSASLNQRGLIAQADAFRGMAIYRDHIDRARASRAAELATALVADLVAVAADQQDLLVEDALASRLGVLMAEAMLAPIDDRVSPSHLAEALVAAAEAAVDAATGEVADAGRVLVAVAGILPYPESETAAEVIARVLPEAPPGPVLAGQVLWTRDVYGSRFAVAAPISTAGQPARWYLWDIDACGQVPLTVHSGFHATPEAALADWQAGVGDLAAADAVFTPVDGSRLVAELMVGDRGFVRVGEENVEQFTEYYRHRRLAEIVRKAVPWQESRSDGDMTAEVAAVEFAEWLSSRDADQPDIAELAAELAESWNLSDIDALYATCSPHRIALCVLHVRDFHIEEFADSLVALLPEWTRWLATRNGMSPELADRCLPYANGQPHDQAIGDDGRLRHLARVIE